MQDISLFPPAARFVFLRTDDAKDLRNYRELLPQEQKVVRDAVDVRKGEFGDARWCAHRALQELGLRDAPPIMKGERGMPLWPPGVTGSLTHTQGFRAAVVAYTNEVAAIGVDAEPAEALPQGVLGQIASQHEQQQVLSLQQAGMSWADKLLFCAKEATYKCWFPLMRRELGFDQAEIDLKDDGTLVAYLLNQPSPVPFFEGRWVNRAGYLIVSAFVPGSSSI